MNTFALTRRRSSYNIDDLAAWLGAHPGTKISIEYDPAGWAGGGCSRVWKMKIARAQSKQGAPDGYVTETLTDAIAELCGEQA